jgi:hypothetical protein
MPDLHSARQRVAEFRLQPLGFYYLHDTQSGGASHRMHIWLPGGPDPTENDQHQHRFDIWSLVVLGSLRNDVFSFLEGQGDKDLEFEVAYANGHSVLRTTGRTGRLEPICTFETRTGGNYFLKAGIIHRAVALEKPCVTLLTANDQDIKVFAYGKRSTEPPSERRFVNAMEVEQISTLLDSIIAKMKK